MSGVEECPEQLHKGARSAYFKLQFSRVLVALITVLHVFYALTWRINYTRKSLIHLHFFWLFQT